MSLADLLTPRKEVLSDEGIEGIIDLANLGDPRKRKLEARPEAFFDLTYPTSDIKRVLRNLDERFRRRGDAPGLYLFEGLKGSGKSHLLVLVYHLFSAPDAARAWLARYGLTCSVPTDALVVINKFTDLPLYSIWDFVFEKLTGSPAPRQTLQPALTDVQTALGDRQVALIFDELEQGIRIIPDPAMKAQNLAFLQMLSEWANRSDKVTVFASIYGDQDEPGSTLKRVSPCRVRFGDSVDRARIVQHRLFENYEGFDPKRALTVIDSFLNTWSRVIPDLRVDEYRSQILQTYPFLPELLDLMLTRVPARGGFQNVRGALGFLANLVRMSHRDADLVTCAHASLSDREVTVRLADLDTTGDLITSARTNLEELRDTPHASQIAATVLLYTLTGTGREVGATREEIFRNVIGPGVDINEVERALLAFQKYASHFHVQENRYFFDVEENEEAKVEYRSLLFGEDRARAEIRKLWRDEIFREPNSVVFTDVEATKEALEALEKDRLRWLLAPRRLQQSERHDLLFGLSNRNQVMILEPRVSTFDADSNEDLLKWGKRMLAGGELAKSAPDAERRSHYEGIARDDKKNVADAIRRAGLSFIRWERYGVEAGEDQMEEESLGPASSKEDVLARLSQDFFPVMVFEEHLEPRLADLFGKSVQQIDSEYHATLGFPVPTTVRSVTAALRNLCKARKLSVRHPRGNYCGVDPDLTETELWSATVDLPFEGEPRSGGVEVVRRPSGGDGPGGVEDTGGTGGGTGLAVESVVEQIAVRAQPGIGRLREEVAARLQERGEVTVTRVRFVVFSDTQVGDLSSLPSALRGTLDGPGHLSTEITIEKEGRFSKAEVERLIEALPTLPQADYGADLWVTVPTSQDH